MTKAPLNQLLRHPDNCCANLDEWLNGVGGKALAIALKDPSTLIPTIKAAGLRGLGGSGFPAYRKWQMIAAQHQHSERYLICNGNEDEPGTFKDRLLLEESPHQVIEGALITALATNINHIAFYINPHLKRATEILSNAIAQWQQSDYLQQISETLVKELVLKIIPSPGHYIAGEETAAIEAVEGNFPFPRGKPPYPAVAGVHGKPTLINNIETLANVSHIVRNGAAWFQALGEGRCNGTKIYCISGDVSDSGAYELPMGISLESLIFQHAGGISNNRKLKAVFTGGPSNSILTADALSLTLDFDSLKQHNASLGTGAMIVIAEGNPIIPHIAKYLDFFAAASCGQCPPCTSGTREMAQLTRKITIGNANKHDLDSLISLSELLPGSGRCHLIDGAVTLLKSSLGHFPKEYQVLINKPFS
ncbi:MAG: SLBB domain-containing protein [Gammaproteobacteria bacterium]|nr:SLBB domain-containing protein [Gammaproteobacteria bacterium]